MAVEFSMSFEPQQDLANLLPARSAGTVVRLLREADLVAFHAYRSDPVLARYQGWSPMAEEAALGFLRNMASIHAPIPGAWIQLAIADAASDRLIGDIGIFLDEDCAIAEVGFTLAGNQQGLGHALRALSMLLPLLTIVTPAKQIRAITDARNTPSIRLLLRLGFVQSNEYQGEFKGETVTEQVYLKSVR